MTQLTINITERGIIYRKGNLNFNGRGILQTLEPTDRNIFNTDPIIKKHEAKSKGLTAIHYGDYEIKLFYSDKFKKVVPFIQNVPGVDAIEILVGNSSRDTKGCILVGAYSTPGQDAISYSQTAFRILMDYLTPEKNSMIKLTIK